MNKLIKIFDFLDSKNFIYIALIVTFFTTCFLNFPGHLSFDSIIQLSEGRTRVYNSMHPPVMSLFLGITDKIIPGTGLFMILNTLLFYLSMILIIKALKRTSILINALFLGVFIHPLFLIYNGIIWKDVLFANLALLGFGFSIFGENRFRLYIRFIASVIFALLILVRQQGILVALIGSIVLSINFESYKNSNNKKLFISIASQFLICAILSKFIEILVKLSAVHYAPASIDIGLRIIMIFDISGIVYQHQELPLQIFHDQGMDVEFLKQEILKYYLPSRFDFLSSPGLVYQHLKDLSTSHIVRQWLNLITLEPCLYLKHRLALFSWQLGLHDHMQCLPFWVGVSSEPYSILIKLGILGSASQYQQVLQRYAEILVNTPFSTGLWYLILSAISLAYLIRRENHASVAMAGLSIAGILFSLTYLPLGIACDLRYIYFSIVAGLISFIYSLGIFQIKLKEN